MRHLTVTECLSMQTQVSCMQCTALINTRPRQQDIKSRLTMASTQSTELTRRSIMQNIACGLTYVDDKVEPIEE